MKRLAFSALLLLLLGAPVRADLPPLPPPPPKPPTNPTKPEPETTVVAGVAGATGLALAGAWLARSRRRMSPQG